MNQWVFAAVLAACLASSAAHGGDRPDAASCPDLADVEGLALVTAPGLASSEARLRLFERAGPSAWKAAGKPMTAMIGRKGMAWTAGEAPRHPGAPVKVEGDGRSPAGVYPLGGAFGFSSGPEGYLRLTPGAHYCVDDPASPHYNAVIPKADAGGASGEDMGTEPLYRQGLFIDYPTDAGAKAGSCIFIHTWRARGSGTAGCVALAEADVKALQRWASGRRALVAILPDDAWDGDKSDGLKSCFPGL